MNPTSEQRGSLAAVEVRLERGSELFGALALAAGEAAPALAGGGQATGRTAAVAVVTVGLGEHAKLLVGDDRGVVRVDEDDLVVLVLPILADPVGVQDLEVGVVASTALFGDALDVLAHGDLADTGLGGLALHVHLALAQATAANAGADDDNALLGLVAEAARGVDAGWLLDAVKDGGTAPLRHAGLPVHVRQGGLRLLPSLADVVVESLRHMDTSASCRPSSPLSALPRGFEPQHGRLFECRTPPLMDASTSTTKASDGERSLPESAG